MRDFSKKTQTHFHLLNQLSNLSILQRNHFSFSNSLTVFPINKNYNFPLIKTVPRLRPIHAAAAATNDGDNSERNEVVAKGSGTTARGRRLLKVREEKRKREYDRLHKYPSWAK